jgi:5-formyltetrahydrofolate cyclo-ligase
MSSSSRYKWEQIFLLKTKLREKYRKIRSEAFQRPLDFAFLQQLQSFLNFESWLIYASVNEEFPTQSVFEFLIQHNKKVFFPRCVKSDLHFHLVSAWDQLAPTGFILEPPETAIRWNGESSGVALVPGLVFNRLGQRIGYGKAYYDRFLSQFPELLRLGLAFEEQISSELWPEETHDQRMDYIFSPAGLWGSKRTKI